MDLWDFLAIWKVEMPIGSKPAIVELRVTYIREWDQIIPALCDVYNMDHSLRIRPDQIVWGHDTDLPKRRVRVTFLQNQDAQQFVSMLKDMGVTDHR